MAESNTKIIYEEQEDILYLSKKRHVKASIEVGDFVIDVDRDGFISGIEILNASENLNLSPEKLSDITNAKMLVTYKPGYVYMVLALAFKDKEKDISIPLTLDLGHRQIERKELVFA